MSKTRILFDLSATQPRISKFDGGSEYAKSVFSQLLLLRKEEVILGSYDANRQLNPKVEDAVQRAGITLINASTKQGLQRLIHEGECDRVYLPLPYRYHDVDFSRVELILTIHGLRALEMPTDKYELVYDPNFLNVLKYVYKRANKRRYVSRKRDQYAELLNTRARRKVIVVPSHHTKYALLSHFPDLREDRIQVAYSPRKQISIPNRNGLENEILRKYDVGVRQYFLLISADRWKKNTFRAIKALDKVFSDHLQINKRALVLGVNEHCAFEGQVDNVDRFSFHGYVDELTLEVLYKNAYLFIFPTLNEGFGYPPLESMKYGTPAICSAIASTTEIYGDAVLYFNPFSIREIGNRILWMLFENGEWEKYSLLGRERSQLIAFRQDNMLDALCRLILAP